ncbi:MAG TPA: hypothetical protein PK718_05035 [Candidatus Methanofastidiosa archaeon]|nr:hypothetical protein [Candidatus Methanofastidiosa archaeon]HPR41895.1 hypothetical protein [Candidatus Methanofastidiosa archaeon]
MNAFKTVRKMGFGFSFARKMKEENAGAAAFTDNGHALTAEMSNYTNDRNTFNVLY